MSNFFYIRLSFLFTVFFALLAFTNACQDGKASEKQSAKENKQFTVFASDSEKFNVLLLPFHPDKDCQSSNYDTEVEVIAAVEASGWAQSLEVDVKLLDDAECPYKPNVARRIGKEHNADVVVWGTYNPKKQEPQILYTWINDVVNGHMGLPQLTDLRNGFYLKDDSYYISNWIVGVTATSKDKWPEALMHFEEIATDKCDVAVTPMIGHCYYSLRREPKVDSIIQIVMGCVPEYVGVAIRGWRHQISLNLQESLDDYTEALKKNPRYRAAYEHRATLLFENRKYKEAAHDFTQAIGLGSDEESVYATRGIAYHNSGYRDKAIEDYTKVMEMYPSNAKVYFDRANAHFILGHYDAALKDYTTGISKEPTTLRAYLNRGITYVEIDNYEAAIADLTHVIESQPENVNALVYRGAAYSFHGKLDEAKLDFIKVLSLDSDNSLAISGREYLEQRISAKDLADEMDRLERERQVKSLPPGFVAPDKEGNIKLDVNNQVPAPPTPKTK